MGPSLPDTAVFTVRLSIGCHLRLLCETATPVLALVHPHDSLTMDLEGPETLMLHPDRPVEVLRDQQGNRWCRFLAPSGTTTFRYAASIARPDQSDPVEPGAALCPVQFLPIDAYPFLDASTYCDTQALMDFAWSTFGRGQRSWALVQDICDWVHRHVRFDYAESRPHQSASQTAAAGAGVCRDFAHLAITLCRCLNIPARYCTGYLGYTGIPLGEAPVDYSAWFEAFLQDRWYVFDARHNIPRRGRVLIARGRDAGDVPVLRSFGAHQLVGFEVITQETAGIECPAAGAGQPA